MQNPKQPNQSSTNERESDRLAPRRRAVGDREKVAVPSNTATNNSNQEVKTVQFLRFGVDSLYLSYQGELYKEMDLKLNKLKILAQSRNPLEQAKAQLSIGNHLFEVKDKGTSLFGYVLEDNAFRIQLARPGKAVPMAYVKISSEYLTYKTPQEAEQELYMLLSKFGAIKSSAHVSRIDLFLDFVSDQDMEAWTREAWVTRAASVNHYSVDGHFTGWAIGMGGVVAARLYDKTYEIFTKSDKSYLFPLWQAMGWSGDSSVWRLEFEFKRDFLHQKDLITLREVLNHLNGLWSYGTTEWLKLTIPNAEDQTRSRWPIHPLWVQLSSVDWETSGGPLKSRFNYARVPDKEAIMKRVLSSLISWMAIEGRTDYDEASFHFFEDLDRYISSIVNKLGLDFEDFIKERVAVKARAFNTIDVNQEIYENYVDEEVEAYRKQSDGE